MAEKILNTKIVVRNDTAANWQTSDPVLRKGEPAFDSTNNLFKIGDGTKKWSELDPISKKDSEILSLMWDNLLRDGEGSKIKADLLDYPSVYSILRAIGDTKSETSYLFEISSPKQGDIAIIQNQIYDDKFEYTAYVFTSDGIWTAMDGNYNAENVYFDEDITITTQIGNITLTNGQGKIPAKGKNLKETFEAILTKDSKPSVTNPSVSISLTGNGTAIKSNQEKEVGTTLTIGYSMSFNKGSYQYGPDTGITDSNPSVRDTNGTTASTKSGSLGDVTIGDSTNYSVTGSVNYTDGTIPYTTLKNECTDKQIKAGTVSATSIHITGYRNMFYGFVNWDGDFSKINSTVIRGLKYAKKVGNGTLTDVKATDVTGATACIVAIPQSSGKVVKSVVMPSAMMADATADYKLQTSTVDVEGANAYTAVPYNVYIYHPAAVGSDEVHRITIG